MNQLDAFLTELGIADATARASIKAQIYIYTFELAIARLDAAHLLDDTDRDRIRRLQASGEISDDEAAAIFNSDPKRKILATALAEAKQLILDAAEEQSTHAQIPR